MGETLKIGELERRSGVPRSTIHFYVAQGLLPPPRKTSRNMAYYGPVHLERLETIKALQARFLPLSAIKAYLDSAAAGADDLHALLTTTVDGAGPPATAERELVRRTGIGRAELAELARMGVVQPVTVGGARRYSDEDVRLVEALAALRRVGLRPEDGFGIELLGLYLGIVEELAGREIAATLARALGHLDPETMQRVADEGLAHANELLGVLHRKALRRLLAGLRAGRAPAEAGRVPPGAGSPRRGRRAGRTERPRRQRPGKEGGP